MTRKHYIAMADQLRETERLVLHLARTSPGFVGVSTTKGAASVTEILNDLNRAVARVFAADNPRFSYERWMTRVDEDWTARR